MVDERRIKKVKLFFGKTKESTTIKFSKKQFNNIILNNKI